MLFTFRLPVLRSHKRARTAVRACLVLACFPALFAQAGGYLITTFAGNGGSGFSGDNGPATSAQLSGPTGVAVDSAGNVYIADGSRVRKVSNGVITTVAVNGTSGYAGDNGPATSAQLNSPLGVAVDSAGNLYIADTENNRVREVSNRVITTVAGGAQEGFSLVVGGPATSADIRPAGIAVDASGNLFIADAYHARVWKLVATPQSTLGCLYSVDQSVLSIGASGGSTGVGVLTSGPGCPWLADSDAGWISGGFGVVQTGTAELTFTVAPNSSSVPRSGTIWVAGQTLTVNQAGVACSSRNLLKNRLPSPTQRSSPGEHFGRELFHARRRSTAVRNVQLRFSGGAGPTGPPFETDSGDGGPDSAWHG